MSLRDIKARQEQMRVMGLLPGALGTNTAARPPKKGLHSNVWRCTGCRVREKWNWSVTLDGRVLDSGTEPLETLARQEAAEALEAARRDLGLLSPSPKTTTPTALVLVEKTVAKIKWVYGVTTVPGRRESLLPRTLDSLKRAGFDAPRLFVDGERNPESWEDDFGLPVTARYPAIRTFGNWTLSLAELYIREPDADRYAVFQDDFVTYPNLRAYLDECVYPDRGYWNLYTFPSNQALCPRDEHNNYREGWYHSNQMGRGAVALVFDRNTVITLLTHQHMVERPLDSRRGWRAVDGGIVTALKKAGWKEWVHNPSLVQHTGDISSMGNKPHKKAESWRGEEFDAQKISGSESAAAAT